MNKERGFEKALEHHIKENPHHWENWVNKKYNGCDKWEYDCVCMIADWAAMGYKFSDTAQQYYENNKERIHIPTKYLPFMYSIFKRL